MKPADTKELFQKTIHPRLPEDKKCVETEKESEAAVYLCDWTDKPLFFAEHRR